MNDEDRSLAERLSRREDAAWEAFCREYSGPLFSAVRLRFACSQELAEEIVHMAFIRCVKSIQTFDPARGRLFDWLRAIAFNEAHTVLRQASVLRPVGLEDQDRQWLERIDQTPLPDERLCREEVRSLVLDTLMGLSERCRQVLVMKYLEDRRVSEIATALGQTDKAVESLLTRSRIAFRELLGRHLDGQGAKGGDWLE